MMAAISPYVVGLVIAAPAWFSCLLLWRVARTSLLAVCGVGATDGRASLCIAVHAGETRAAGSPVRLPIKGSAGHAVQYPTGCAG
jgi:hypothetical protein